MRTLLGKQSGDKSLIPEQVESVKRICEELQTSWKNIGEDLRVQNEELAAARQAVETERQRYQELFDFAPDGYLVTT